jgi:hypothetical protein
VRYSIREYYCSDKKIIVWGSGSGYIRWNQKIDFQAAYIIDNNQEKWGTVVNGLEVKSPDTLLHEEKSEILVFVISSFFREIREQLIKMGCEKKNIVSLQMLEQKMLLKERIERREQFLSESNLSLQEFIETIADGIGGLNYREVKLLPVLLPYITLLASYLYENDIYKFLFPVPQKREYMINGNAPILISYVWHKDHRPDHYEIMNTTLQDIPSDLYMQMELKSYYDDSVYLKQETFEYNSSDLKFKPLVDKLTGILSVKSLCLTNAEIEWFIHFTLYFLHFVDFVFTLLGKYPIKKYVSAFSNNSEENIIVQAAKRLGVKTFGLQHGTYGKKEEYNQVPFSHVYRYPTVDEMLVWGSYQENILKEIQLDDSKIMVVGNAKYNLTQDERSLLKDRKQSFVQHQTFLILFMGPGNGEKIVNQDLLTFSDQLCRQYGWNYILKLHPGTRLSMSEFQYDSTYCKEFIDHHVRVNSLFQEVDFILTSSSAAIYEAVYEYVPTFVYDYHPAVASICGGLSTVFSNYEQLTQKCSKLMHKEVYDRLIEEYDVFGNQVFQTDYIRPSEKYKRLILQ